MKVWNALPSECRLGGSRPLCSECGAHHTRHGQTRTRVLHSWQVLAETGSSPGDREGRGDMKVWNALPSECRLGDSRPLCGECGVPDMGGGVDLRALHTVAS